MVVYTTYQTIYAVPDEALARPPVGEIRQAPEALPPGLVNFLTADFSPDDLKYTEYLA